MRLAKLIDAAEKIAAFVAQDRGGQDTGGSDDGFQLLIHDVLSRRFHAPARPRESCRLASGIPQAVEDSLNEFR